MLKKLLFILIPCVIIVGMSSLLSEQANFFSGFIFSDPVAVKPADENKSEFDFNLNATAKGQFELRLKNQTNEALSIKVYDVIGNIVVADCALKQGAEARSYDLSHYKSQLFFVEVGNEQHQKLKRVVAS